MKRFIYLILTGIMLCTGCTDTMEGLDVEDVITTSIENIDSDCLGGKTTVEVNAYCEWNISSDENWDWVEVSHKSGSKGKTSLDITIEPNTSVNKRTATLTLYNDKYNLSRKIEVAQENNTPFISVSDKNLTFASIGETQSITVESNIAWKVVADDYDWLTITPTKGELGATTMKIEAEANRENNDRKATVTLSGTGSDDKVTAEITILQQNDGPYIILSESEIDVPSVGCDKSVTIESNISWSASCSADWITLSPKSGNKGATTMQITIKSHSQETPRSATIKISNSEQGVSKEIKVTQFTPYIKTDKSSINFAATNNSAQTVVITTNLAWKISCDADWITVLPRVGDAGTTAVEIIPLDNNLSQERTATIEVKATDDKITTSAKIVVTQQAGTPYLSVSTNYIELSGSGESKSVTINANCSWRASSSADWINVSPSLGSNASSVTIKVAKCITGEEREAKVIVENTQYNLSAEIIVKQGAWYAITYTTKSSLMIQGIDNLDWGANVISHTYGEIVFDGPVTQIPDEAFKSITQLIISIGIPNSVKKIGYKAFYYCLKLESIEIPDNVTEIAESAFDGCQALKYVKLPAGISKISQFAFQFCSSLSSIEIPDNVTEIENSAFFHCSNLTDVTLSENLKTIGANAFSSCEKLESITIPKNVTEIHSWAFNGCSGLQTVYCKPLTPPSSYSPFDGIDGLIIYVPRNSVEQYKEAWYSVESQIQGYDF